MNLLLKTNKAFKCLFVYFLLLCVGSIFSMNKNEAIQIEHFTKILPEAAKTDILQWTQAINNIFGDNNKCLQIGLYNGFSGHYYKNKSVDFPEIKISKARLLELNFSKIAVIQKAQCHCLSKEELLLFDELPEDLQNNVKNYFYVSSDGGYHWDTDRRMSLRYKKKLTLVNVLQAILNSCRQLLPILIPTLLYNHVFVDPMDNLWKQIQDPFLLEENRKKELTNQLIENLQINLVPGSELLKQEIMYPVPFEWIFFSENNNKRIEYYLKSVLSIIISQLTVYKQFDNYLSKKYYINSRNDEGRFVIRFICHLLVLTISVPSQQLSKAFFEYGIPLGLIGIVCVTSMLGVIKLIITSCVPRGKSIDFYKEKFKDKSMKQVLDYYLGKSTIEIV